MSLVKANTYQDASGGSNAVFSGVASPPSSMGFRNRIINGNMVIDQRNAGAAISSLGATATYTVDRFYYQSGNAGRFSAQQNAGSVTPPASFTRYLGFTSLGANTPASGDFAVLAQAIEGFNGSDLAWGTASAQTITLSFWVRSSITGTQSVAIINGSSNRSYSQTYTINSANTWEQKVITIPGDTSGTWATDNTAFALIRFPLGTGSSNLTTPGVWNASNSNGATGTVAISATNGATFYITGVQLEAGTNASAFEQIDYGRELAMCQRYYAKSYNTSVVPGTVGSFDGAVAIASTGTAAGAAIASFGFPAEMRAPPTMTFYSGNSGASGVWRDSGSSTDKTVIIYLNAGTRGGTVYNTATMSGAAVGLYGHWVAAIEL
jgi:hypothetical protein